MTSEYIALGLLLVGTTLFVLLLAGCFGFGNGTVRHEEPDYLAEAGPEVAYEVYADRDWIWEGFIEEIYYPDYDELGGELTDAGCISDSITGRNVVGAVMDHFEEQHGNWAADSVEDAGLLAMVYVNVERNRPRPPVIRPVTAHYSGGRVQWSLKADVGVTQVGGAGWEHLFATAGVSVSVSAQATASGWVDADAGYLEPGYYETPPEYRGWHTTIAIEVYYLADEGEYKQTGRSAMAGMAYLYSETKPGHNRLESIARVLVDRMQAKADR
jgi:hypothetical protein